MNEEAERFVFEDRNGWRRWLRRNHGRQREVWLVLPKRSAEGVSYRVFYNQAVEEALCFGWIDSRIKPLDVKRSLVRFSPRKSKNWSRYNIERALDLMKRGKMTKAGSKLLPEDVIIASRRNQQ